MTTEQINEAKSKVAKIVTIEQALVNLGKYNNAIKTKTFMPIEADFYGRDTLVKAIVECAQERYFAELKKASQLREDYLRSKLREI